MLMELVCGDFDKVFWYVFVGESGMKSRVLKVLKDGFGVERNCPNKKLGFHLNDELCVLPFLGCFYCVVILVLSLLSSHEQFSLYQVV